MRASSSVGRPNNVSFMSPPWLMYNFAQIQNGGFTESPWKHALACPSCLFAVCFRFSSLAAAWMVADLGQLKLWHSISTDVHVFVCLFPTRQEGVVRLESAFAMLQHHAPTQYPARAARQWIPPSILPEQLASGSRPVSRRVSRQSGSPVDDRQSGLPVDPIPPSIPPEQPASRSRRELVTEYLASGSRRVSRQSSSPVNPAECPTRAARQRIPPSIPLTVPE